MSVSYQLPQAQDMKTLLRVGIMVTISGNAHLEKNAENSFIFFIYINIH